MKSINQTILCLLAIVIVSQVLNAQTQTGTDIDGEAIENYSGRAVSMPDANTLAIGADYNAGNGFNAGHVRVFTWNGSEWVQKGIDIDGEAADDHSGYSVSMPDSNTVAIGAYLNDGNGVTAGHVRIYSWDGTSWMQKGTDIDGEAEGDWFGFSVSMPDANTIAIGAPYNGGNGALSGHVRIYTWDGSAWEQIGTDIDGEAMADQSGFSVSMPDPNTVAIGAPTNDGTGFNAGNVRIYTWNSASGSWEQKGANLNGEAEGDKSGKSVSMPDANTVAIGTPGNAGNGIFAGHARIYTWNGSAWVQKGIDIDGESANDQSGESIVMPDANTVAIGAIYNDGNGINAGHVRIYTWNSSAWVQNGDDIDGEAADDESGYSVSMTDSNTVAIGAIFNDGNGSNAGHVKVYSLATGTAIHENSFGKSVTVLPNPTTGQLSINLGDSYPEVRVNIKNTLGQEILNISHASANQLEVNIEGEPGVYFIEVVSGNKNVMLKVVKR